eukprot:scaffold7067_cov49-Phaeocystis_antarctica.AAC.2
MPPCAYVLGAALPGVHTATGWTAYGYMRDGSHAATSRVAHVVTGMLPTRIVELHDVVSVLILRLSKPLLSKQGQGATSVCRRFRGRTQFLRECEGLEQGDGDLHRDARLGIGG